MLNHLRNSFTKGAATFAAFLLGAMLTGAIAQGVILSVQTGVPTGPSITALGNSNDGLYFGTNRVGVAGHLEGGVKLAGSVPVATICGAQPVAGSTDNAGTIVNIGTTTCTLTFGSAYAAAPSCVVLDSNVTHAIGVVISAAAITITGGTAADTYTWLCMAKSGG